MYLNAKQIRAALVDIKRIKLHWKCLIDYSLTKVCHIKLIKLKAFVNKVKMSIPEKAELIKLILKTISLILVSQQISKLLYLQKVLKHRLANLFMDTV